jgi:hypothetical protein
MRPFPVLRLPHVCFIRVAVSSRPSSRLGFCKQNSGNEPCQTTSFSLGSSRVTIQNLGHLSSPLLLTHGALLPPIAAARQMKRESGLRSKLPRSVFWSSGPTSGHELPDGTNRRFKKKAVPGGTAKSREETSKKADSATRVALLRFRDVSGLAGVAPEDVQLLIVTRRGRWVSGLVLVGWWTWRTVARLPGGALIWINRSGFPALINCHSSRRATY